MDRNLHVAVRIHGSTYLGTDAGLEWLVQIFRMFCGYI